MHTRKQGRSGNPEGTKGLNREVLELAVTLRMQRVPWRAIARQVGVNLSTLIRWKDRPEWEETRTRILQSLPDSLLYLARAVVVEALRAELGHRVRKPKTELALKVLDRFDPAMLRPTDDGESAAGAGPSMRQAVIILPPETKGSPGRSPTEVLLPHLIPPPALPEPPPDERARVSSQPKRRVVVAGAAPTPLVRNPRPVGPPARRTRERDELDELDGSELL